MVELTVRRYAEALLEQAEQLVGLLDGADLSRRVPTCPDWDVRRLVEHIGQAHRHGARMVETRAEGPPDYSGAPRPTLPDDPAERARWLREGAARVVDAVRSAGPDEPVWNFSGGDPRAAFWLRRMCHETAVHRADAAIALDAPYEVAPDVAADAISEWLSLVTSPGLVAFRPEQAAALRGSGETLHLHATDSPSLGEAGEWLIRRGPEAVTWEHGHQKGDVAVRGLAKDLLQVILGRIGPGDERLQVFGDPALLDHWVAHATF